MRFVEFFIPNFIDMFVVVACIVTAHLVIGKVSKNHRLGADKFLLIKLYYYHLAFAVIYMLYILNNGGDSIGYWRPPTRFIALNSSFLKLHQPGSSFVHFIAYPFSQVMGISLWGGTFIFSLVGYFGFVCIYLTLRSILKVNPTLFGYKVLPAVLFLPNMHFWSGGVGKDTLIFFGLAMFIYALTNIRRNIPGLVASFYVIFFIRPHIAFVCLIAFGCALFLSSKGISAFTRIAFIVVVATVFLIVSPVVMSFIGVEDDSIESYEDVANIRAKNLSRAKVGSSISMSSYPVPVKIFTFLYRPLFFDGGNLFGMVVSLENLFYLSLTLATIRGGVLRIMFRMPLVLKVCLLIVCATSFFMSSSLSNLGIIIRQKNMVMFMLVLTAVYILNELQWGSQSLRAGRLRRYAVPRAGKSAL